MCAQLRLRLTEILAVHNSDVIERQGAVDVARVSDAVDGNPMDSDRQRDEHPLEVNKIGAVGTVEHRLFHVLVDSDDGDAGFNWSEWVVGFGGHNPVK